MEFRQGEAGRDLLVLHGANTFRRLNFFVDSGYTSADCVRQMQDQERQYFATDMRRGANGRETLRDIRLVVGIFDLFATRMGDGKPKYEEITIRGGPKCKPPSPTNLLGARLRDRDMRNRFSFELAKGARNLRESPSSWANYVKSLGPPHGSAHTRPRRAECSPKIP